MSHDQLAAGSMNITGEAYRAESGQWSFRIVQGETEIAGGGGYSDEFEADAAMADVLAGYALGSSSNSSNIERVTLA